jgi:hypothetical protein
MESLFALANSSVLPGWLLLIVAPRWPWTYRYTSLAIPLVLGALYAWLLRNGLGQGDFNSLAGVMQLFTQPSAAFAGWVHYLIFDLFTGAWETRDGLRLGIPRWLLLPCQLLTFLLGPLGLLLYLALRGGWKKQWDLGA